jgi:hypothetical protein
MLPLVPGCIAGAVDRGKGHADSEGRFRVAGARSITTVDGKSYRFGASDYCGNSRPLIDAATGVHFRRSRWPLVNQYAPCTTVGVTIANLYNLGARLLKIVAVNDSRFLFNWTR